MNLTKLSEVVKRTIIGIIAFSILFVIFKVILIPAGKIAYKTLFPPKDLPNPIYGLLDPPEFVEQNIVGTINSFELNTKTGKLPTNIPQSMPVYKYKNVPFSYNAGKEATQDATFLGFGEKDLTTSLKGDTYKWRNTQTGGTLEIYINTKALELYTNLEGKGSFYVPGSITKTSAIETAKRAFLTLGRFNDTLYKTGTQEVALGKISGTKVLLAQATSEAQIARVDFFRAINKIPIVGPNRRTGLLSIVLGTENKDIPALTYPQISTYHWELEAQTNATYPIIPVNLAWEAVKKGEGVISNVTPETQSPFENYQPTRVDNVIINNIYLAYYDNTTPQKYLQPIYVFDGNYTSASGKGEIAIYFPAIAGEYIKSQ